MINRKENEHWFRHGLKMSAGESAVEATAENSAVSPKAEEQLKLEPMELPAVFAGFNYVLVALPDARIYFNWYVTSYDAKNSILLPINANEVAQIACDVNISILKTDGRTINKFMIDINESGKKKIKEEVKYYDCGIKLLAKMDDEYDIRYYNIIVQTDGKLRLLKYGENDIIIRPQTIDGKMINPIQINYCDSIITLIGEDNYCYVSTKNKPDYDIYDILLIDDKPIKVSKISNTLVAIMAMDFDGTVHIWNHTETIINYHGTVKEENLKDVKMKTMSGRGDVFVGLDTDGDCHCTAHERIEKDFPKDENGKKYKMRDVDVNYNSAAGITEDGNTVVWGNIHGAQYMISEEGERLNIFTGKTVKSARKC